MTESDPTNSVLDADDFSWLSELADELPAPAKVKSANAMSQRPGQPPPDNPSYRAGTRQSVPNASSALLGDAWTSLAEQPAPWEILQQLQGVHPANSAPSQNIMQASHQRLQPMGLGQAYQQQQQSALDRLQQTLRHHRQQSGHQLPSTSIHSHSQQSLHASQLPANSSFQSDFQGIQPSPVLQQMNTSMQSWAHSSALTHPAQTCVANNGLLGHSPYNAIASSHGSNDTQRHLLAQLAATKQTSSKPHQQPSSLHMNASATATQMTQPQAQNLQAGMRAGMQSSLPSSLLPDAPSGVMMDKPADQNKGNEMHLWSDILDVELPQFDLDPNLPVVMEDPFPDEMNQLPSFDLPLTSNANMDDDDDFIDSLVDDPTLALNTTSNALPPDAQNIMSLDANRASQLFDTLMGSNNEFLTPNPVPASPPPSRVSTAATSKTIPQASTASSEEACQPPDVSVAMATGRPRRQSASRPASHLSSTDGSTTVTSEAYVKEELVDDDGVEDASDPDHKPKRKRARRRKLVAQLSAEEKERTRHVNRVAAQRHRVIAKAKKKEKQERFDKLMQRNEELHRTVQELRGELSTLRRLVIDMYGPGGARALAFLQSGSNASYLGL
eukprot:TRINITY_DN856_c0_g1_i1.p1 TRINITY_DN856_c0_g1~~TRINITY_DN856_c0_g1_i1.p1  ORF type:complete len:613 (+),score=105.58 TRINITY_DN856_c0_g1_i1:166-2004(+)